MTPTPDRIQALRAHAAMLGFAALISGSFSLGGLAARHIDPAALTAPRFLLGALLMAGFAAPVLRRDHFRAPWRHLVLGGLFAAYFIFMFQGLALADPVSIGAVYTLTPIMTAGFGYLLLRQRTTPAIALALAIGATGALWVIFRADAARALAFDIGPGEALFLIGCAAHALYTPLVKRLHRGEPLVVYALGTMLGGAVVSGVVAAPAIVATDWAGLPAVVWWVLAYLAVFTTGLTFWLMQFAALRLPSAKVMAYGYLLPSLVTLWEGAQGHGWPAPPVLIGVGLTLMALAVLLRPDARGATDRRVAAP